MGRHQRASVRTCGHSGCPEQVSGRNGYCPEHSNTRRSPSSRVTSTAAWRRLRLTILKRDNWTCHYCGKRAATVDHVNPVSRGGAKMDPANLVASCGYCNFSKQDRETP